MNYKLKEMILRAYGRQWVFAKAIGEHEALVSRVITGAIDLNQAKKEAWAAKLNSPVDFLFADTDEG